MARELSFVCDISGLSAPAAHYDDIDDELPEGWLEITVKRVVKNPDYEEVMSSYEATREQALEAQMAQVADGADREHAQQIAEAMVDQLLRAPEIDEYEVVERVYIVHPDQAATVLSAFAEADAEVEEE